MAILWFIIVLLIATVLHECGHFIAAKDNGVIASGFNIGVGPLLKSWKTKDTSINLRLLPIGGYCEFEDGQLESLSPAKRILVFAAGPIVNFILAFLFFQIFYLCYYLCDQYYLLQPVTDPGPVFYITMLVKGTFAFFRVCFEYIGYFFKSIVAMFRLSTPTFIEGGRQLNNTLMRGVILAEYLEDMSYIGFLCNFILGLANILPIPALDGGHIFLTLPALFGKPLNEKAYNRVSYVFYVLIMGLSVLYIAKDIIMTIVRVG